MAGDTVQGHEPLIELKDLTVRFILDEGIVRAVDGVSGCGKSVTARSILRLNQSAGETYMVFRVEHVDPT